MFSASMHLVCQPEWRNLNLAIQLSYRFKCGPACIKHAQLQKTSTLALKNVIEQENVFLYFGWSFSKKKLTDVSSLPYRMHNATQIYVYPIIELFDDKNKRLTYIYFYRLSCSMHPACCIPHACWRMNRIHTDQYFTRLLILEAPINFFRFLYFEPSRPPNLC